MDWPARLSVTFWKKCCQCKVKASKVVFHFIVSCFAQILAPEFDRACNDEGQNGFRVTEKAQQWYLSLFITFQFSTLLSYRLLIFLMVF